MKKLITLGAATLAATPALAHHPLAGMPMETFAHGMLSGAGHPVLGFDHLFFVAVMGVAAVFTGHRFTAPLAYIAAMLLGCVLMYAGIGLPAKEAVIALSLLAIGGLVLSGRALSIVPALVLFGAFGAFHGSAFGDSMAGQEGGVGGAVLLGYLIGLGAVQYLVALGAGHVVEKLSGAVDASAANVRIAGAMAAGVGLFLCLELIETPLLSLITG